jgi:hypothetical protein
VNVRASSWRSIVASISRRAGVDPAGRCQRYTGTSSTSAGSSRASASANSGAAPSRCTTTRCPATPSAASLARISPLVSPGAVHVTSNPTARAAASAFGPRAITAARLSAARSSSSMPTLWAAPNQERTPIPVGSTTRSTAAANTRRVAAIVASASSSSTVDIVGPWTTRPPRRDSISSCSSQRRWPVMPMV